MVLFSFKIEKSQHVFEFDAPLELHVALEVMFASFRANLFLKGYRIYF